MMCLDYIGSLDDPKKAHEYDCNGHILDILMKYVKKIQQKKQRPLVLEKGDTKFDFWISGPLPFLAVSFIFT